MAFSFSIQARDGRARLGTLHTPHGLVQTPAFMAVGTRGSIKGVTPDQARACGCQMVLGNTYHLLLPPGPEGVGGGQQALFPIVQGGTDLAARAASARFLTALDMPGYALGGLAVGEGHERMVETIAATAPLLPENKPRYLMGVGYAADILAAVRHGIDMFDCVLPTRNGRNGLAFTFDGTRRLRNAKYTLDQGPLEAGCDCYCCQNF